MEAELCRECERGGATGNPNQTTLFDIELAETEKAIKDLDEAVMGGAHEA